MLAPVQGPRVWMNPEEATVTRFGHCLAPCLPRVLPKELATHGLCDGLDHARVCHGRVQAGLAESHARGDIEMVINLGAERRY